MGNAGARYYSTMDGTGHILITMNATVLSVRSQFLYKNTHLTRAHCCGVLVDRFSLLSRFQTGFYPGFGTGTRLPG